MTSRPLIFLGVVIIIIAAVAAVGYVMNNNAVNPVEPIPTEPVATTSPVVETPPSTPPASTATSSPFASIPYPASSTADTSAWAIYVDKGNQYSIEYPSDLIRDNSAAGFAILFPKNAYFRWPLLDDAKVTITVAAKCPALIGGNVAAKTSADTFDLNGYHFTRSIGTDVGAGQLYTEIAYDTVSKGNCYHISFLNHSTNGGAALYVDNSSLIKKYDAEHATDLAKVYDVFGAMIKTLKILAPTS